MKPLNKASKNSFIYSSKSISNNFPEMWIISLKGTKIFKLDIL